MNTIIDRIVAHASRPDVYDPPTAGQMLQVGVRCRALQEAASNVSPALRQLAIELCKSEEWQRQKMIDTLMSCADDLDFANGMSATAAQIDRATGASEESHE